MSQLAAWIHPLVVDHIPRDVKIFWDNRIAIMVSFNPLLQQFLVFLHLFRDALKIQGKKGGKKTLSHFLKNKSSHSANYLEETVNHHVEVKYGPLGLDVLKVLKRSRKPSRLYFNFQIRGATDSRFAFLVVAPARVLELSAIAVAEKALESVATPKTANNLGLCPRIEDVVVGGEARPRDGGQQGSVRVLGTRLSWKESLENGSVPIVSIDIDVDDGNGRSFLPKQVATINSLQGSFGHSDRTREIHLKMTFL